ncbi:hypothetical protein GALMADRAFT_222829 [Galerina marginata CBS 339.88]|uniref:F-box domain-containing protein n=1 Tax=Galerina marginata (strain CBS 339.88) TaxID=685588 RepID=A0A067T9M3_GALM3|nr:hypothetical protein GALMADRAFT_222829 [Galerina marginata CBS 339.88]
MLRWKTLKTEISAETNHEVVVTKKMQGDRTTIDSFKFPVGQACLREDPLVDSFIFSGCTRTGTVPTSIEIARLDQFREDCETEIGRLDKQITETESTVLQSCFELARLYARLMTKKKQLHAARSFCAPVRTLPPDVLNVVFEMCLPEGFYTLNKRNAPLILCHVCKLWRDIAINNTLLWKSPRFDLSARLNKYSDAIRAVLERAQKRSLYLQLWGHLSFSDTCRRLLVLFADFFPKCKMLDLFIATTALYRGVCKLDAGGNLIFENLQSLSLSISNSKDLRPTFPGAVKALCTFRKAPRLEQVYLKLPHPSFLQNTVIPYSQLLKFGCSLVLRSSVDLTTAISTWKRTLSKCTKIESIEVAFLPAPGKRVSIQDAHPQEVAHISMRALTVTVDIDGNIDAVFDGLNFEGQEEMTFDAAQPCEIRLDQTTVPIADMHTTLHALGHTFFGLSRLTLLRVFIADRFLLPVFQMTPTLRYLEILHLKPCDNFANTGRWIDDDSQLLALITKMVATSPAKLKDALFPNLDHLHLYYSSYHKDHAEKAMAYANLVQARSTMNSAMKEDSDSPTGSHFILELSFSKYVHSKSVISSVLTGINHENCHADVCHKVVNDFSWTAFKLQVKDEYSRLFDYE